MYSWVILWMHLVNAFNWLVLRNWFWKCFSDLIIVDVAACFRSNRQTFFWRRVASSWNWPLWTLLALEMLWTTVVGESQEAASVKKNSQTLSHLVSTVILLKQRRPPFLLFYLFAWIGFLKSEFNSISSRLNRHLFWLQF